MRSEQGKSFGFSSAPSSAARLILSLLLPVLCQHGHAQTRPEPQGNGGRYCCASDGTVYFIDQGLARPITKAANDQLFGNSDWRADSINLSKVSKGELLGDDAHLAKSSDGSDQTIFLMELRTNGWVKRPITSRGSENCGFNLSKIALVSQTVLDGASTADTIDYPPQRQLWDVPHLNGRRYLNSADKGVYLIDNGNRRRLIGRANDNLFGNSNWRDADLTDVLEATPVGDDAYLAKSSNGSDQTVFLMERRPNGWVKRPITKQGAANYGFNISKLVLVAQTVLDGASTEDTIGQPEPPPPHPIQPPRPPPPPPCCGSPRPQPPQGACSYHLGDQPRCTYNHEADCTALHGAWDPSHVCQDYHIY